MIHYVISVGFIYNIYTRSNFNRVENNIAKTIFIIVIMICFIFTGLSQYSLVCLSFPWTQYSAVYLSIKPVLTTNNVVYLTVFQIVLERAIIS